MWLECGKSGAKEVSIFLDPFCTFSTSCGAPVKCLQGTKKGKGGGGQKVRLAHNS